MPPPSHLLVTRIMAYNKQEESHEQRVGPSFNSLWFSPWTVTFASPTFACFESGTVMYDWSCQLWTSVFVYTFLLHVYKSLLNNCVSQTLVSDLTLHLPLLLHSSVVMHYCVANFFFLAIKVLTFFSSPYPVCCIIDE